MLVFLGLAGTPVNNLPAWREALAPVPIAVTPLVTTATPAPSESARGNPGDVLSASDAALYRQAFAFQEQGQWAQADEALAKVGDKRLMGHVLADRYLRRGLTVAEAQQWMAAYADLAEAPAIYEQARHIRGIKIGTVAHPVAALAWGGGDGVGTPFGFRSPAETGWTPQKLRINAKIHAALQRGSPAAARDLLAAEAQRGALTTAEAGNIASHIAASFFYQGQIDRARPLAHWGAQSGSPLGLWIDGLAAWKQQDIVTATRSFASLAQAPGLSPWDHAAAAYWGYRAATRLGDQAQAHHWLAEAAKYPRSFYGYMAASISGKPAGRSWKMPELTARYADLLATYPAGWQALALAQIGQNDSAEGELRRLNPTGQRPLQNAILALAEQAHMPSLTLQLGGIATNDNGQPYEAALYPLPPWQPVGGFKIDRALIYALMKRESQFDPEAVSQSGACGLMQIMPSTAQLMSHEQGEHGDCPDRLFDPATNMEMGQHYVRMLADQPMIGDNLLLLLAAYNGGPGNLARWLDGEDRGDPLLFLESMPMRETRDYVQQVLIHYWMYRARLAEPENSVAQLARGQWPRYAINDNGMPDLRRAQAQSVELASAARQRGSR